MVMIFVKIDYDAFFILTVSICSAIFIVFLLLSEFYSFITTDL